MVDAMYVSEVSNLSNISLELILKSASKQNWQKSTQNLIR